MVGKLQPALFPARVRPGRRRAARRRRRARAVRRARRRGRRRDRHARARRRQVAEGFLDIAVDEHGERDQAHLGAARLRRHRVHAVLLRRRRRPARLPGRRRARHDARASSIRSPACCRPTAWASPTCARCASSAVEAPLDGAALADVAARARRARRRGARRARGAGHRARRASTCSGALHLKYEGTDTALDRRRSATSPAMRRASSRRAYRAAFGFLMPGKRARRRGGRRSRRSAPATPADERAPAFAPRAGALAPSTTQSACSRGGALARRRRSTRARRCARATRSPARRSSPRATRPPSSSRAGARRVTRARPPGARARRRRARARTRSAPRADPVLLEVFNNLFMAIAEQMGLRAAEHRVLGEHQGAPRLLVRAVRRRRQPDRQRAAHAGAPGLDGRERSRR